MTKLFISYRSLDSAKVDMIVEQLRSLSDDDGAPHYDIWQDKTSIPVGQDWWKAIIQGIINCDVFVFMMSHESVKNINCRAELSYARKRNRPIIPLVLADEFIFNPATGKNDVSYADDLPDEMKDTRAQMLFYDADNFIAQFNDAVRRLIRMSYRDLPAPEPPDPRNANDGTNDTALMYERACDYAWRMEFATAEKLFQRLIGWNDDLFAEDAHDWIMMLREYQQILKLDSRASVRYKVPQLWEQYAGKFPKPFVPMFDPKGIGDRYRKRPFGSTNVRKPGMIQPDLPQPKVKTPAPAKTQGKLLEKSAVSVRNIIGGPFAWCEVPAGEFVYGENSSEQVVDLPAFALAKYPVTYSQFQVFIDDKDGFQNQRWWEGLARDQSDEPDYSYRGRAVHPRERVSWYDTIAFCRWLSSKLGGRYDLDNISTWTVRLPTEFEWEKAARGTDGLIYPYGNDLDKDKANTRESGIGHTTSVTQYTNGASPYEVMDMSGNVWEWCLTDHRHPQIDPAQEDLHSHAYRVLRGGSFSFGGILSRAASRSNVNPSDRDYGDGFRLCFPL